MTRVVFNGKEYSSVDEMPPDVRKLYDDVIASIASPDKAGGSGGVHIKVATRLVVNGKEYTSVHEMPPLVRAAYEKLAHLGGAALATANPAETPSVPLAVEANSRSLDAQLRLSPSTRFLITLVVVGALAAFFLWR